MGYLSLRDSFRIAQCFRELGFTYVSISALMETISRYDAEGNGRLELIEYLCIVMELVQTEPEIVLLAREIMSNYAITAAPIPKAVVRLAPLPRRQARQTRPPRHATPRHAPSLQARAADGGLPLGGSRPNDSSSSQ